MSCPLLVSACLLGLNTRYNRIQKRNAPLLELLRRYQLTPLPVCPEQLAGLSTPRPATRFSHGDGEAVHAGCGAVVNSQGVDVTRTFIDGAEQTLLAARLGGCQIAVLKERSPSCGVHQIYLEDRVVAGSGVTTALLRSAGMTVFSEAELDRLASYLTEADDA